MTNDAPLEQASFSDFAMESSAKLLLVADWKAIFAGAAFVLSLFNLWYTFFRRGTLIFACARWTAMAVLEDQNDPSRIGLMFATEVNVVNTGSRPFVLRDILLEASSDTGEKLYYDPIFLFDLTGFVQNVGRGVPVLHFQRGQAPFPITVPKSDQIALPHALLFLPQHGNFVEANKPHSVTLRMFALTDAWKDYKEVASQEFDAESLQKLSLGTFNAALPTQSVSQRNRFIASRTTAGTRSGRLSLSRFPWLKSLCPR